MLLQRWNLKMGVFKFLCLSCAGKESEDGTHSGASSQQISSILDKVSSQVEAVSQELRHPQPPSCGWSRDQSHRKPGAFFFFGSNPETMTYVKVKGLAAPPMVTAPKFRIPAIVRRFTGQQGLCRPRRQLPADVTRGAPGEARCGCGYV